MYNGTYVWLGETLDFVLTASKSQGIFDMTVSSEGHCMGFNLTHTLNVHYNFTFNDIVLLDAMDSKQSVSIN